MSDDDEYYEFEDEYMYEDLVPDMVVSSILITSTELPPVLREENSVNSDPNQNCTCPGRSRRFLTLRSRAI